MTSSGNKPASHVFQWAEGTLDFLIVLFCLGFVAVDLFIIFSRLFYPYQLEWMEGASLVQVNRILLGGSLYVSPSIFFVPLIYPPLYFYLSAGLAKLIGLGFGALRLVSLLSSLTCALILYLAVYGKTRKRFAGILAVGCFASSFMLTGQWFDIARVDMLAAALSMLAIYLAREPDQGTLPRTAALAGVVFALALLAKQSALGVALAAMVYLLIFNWRRSLWLMFAFAVSTGLLYGIFWLESAGWINYYLYAIPAAHAFNFEVGRVLSVLISQFAPIPLWLLLGLFPVFFSLKKTLADRGIRYYLVMAGALIATGTIGRLNAFAGPNVYVSSYLGISLMVGLEAGWILDETAMSLLHRMRPGFIALETLFLSVQFAFLLPAFVQAKTIPTSQDRAAGEALVSRIRQYPGEVIAPDTNYLTMYAGKTPYYNEMAMSEIRGEGNLYPMPEWPPIFAQLTQLMHAPTTSAVIVDFLAPVGNLVADCRQERITYLDKATFAPVAGPPNARPSLIITCH